MKRIFTFLLVLNAGYTQAQQKDSIISDAQKIYGLSRFWQEANYNYAYFSNVPTLNWDSAYQAFVPKVLATKTVFDYYRVLQRFCALLKDGHTNIYFPNYIQNNRTRRSFGDIKLELQNIDGKPIVVNTAFTTKDVVPIGSEIIRVNNMPVKQYIDEFVRPYIAQSASYIIEDWCVDYLLEGFNGDTIRIDYRKHGNAGTVQSLLLKGEVKQGVTWLNAYSNSLYGFKWLPGEIAKIDLNSFGDRRIVDSFIAALPALQKAKGIIIDLRRNGGGNSDNSAAIISYFTNQDTIRGGKWLTREHRASFKAWGSYAMQNLADSSEWSNKAREYYKGNVWFDGGQMTIPNTAPVEKRMTNVQLAILFGHQTASAAEDFLIMMDELPDRAVTLGQRSFASTGQPIPFSLPGGGSARICTKQDTYPDGRKFVGSGIVPDFEINPTIEDYLQQKDATVEKAISLLNKKIK
ncbi:MAG: peptidase S41 [Gloeobacteraceae cyanobacterium ES-bin-316]|nr:peptidase S41 [Ferruginibacter sp.]